MQFAVGSDPGLMEFKNGSVVFLEVKDDRKIKIPGGSQPCPFWPLLVPVVTVMTLQVFPKNRQKDESFVFFYPESAKLYFFTPTAKIYSKVLQKKYSFMGPTLWRLACSRILGVS